MSALQLELLKDVKSTRKISFDSLTLLKKNIWKSTLLQGFFIVALTGAAQMHDSLRMSKTRQKISQTKRTHSNGFSLI